MTKGSGHAIFLSASVRQMLTRPRDDLVLVASMEVRGKDEPVTVWSVA
jgi:class 3 adenylate cyclase